MLWESCKSIPQGYAMFPEKVAKLWNVVPHTKVGTILYSMVQHCRVWVCVEYYATALLFDELVTLPYTDVLMLFWHLLLGCSDWNCKDFDAF